MEKSPRRSSRLKTQQGSLSRATAQLPSPSSSFHLQCKRRRSESPANLSKRLNSCGNSQQISFWAKINKRDADLPNEELLRHAKRSRRRSTSATSSRSKHRLNYLSDLESHAMYIDEILEVEKETRAECNKLLSGKRKEHMYSPFSKVFPLLLKKISPRNEDRVRRDLGEWVVPSPETLLLLGAPEQELQQLNEEINAQWSRCEPMGGTSPKPDFVVGFRPSAFTDEERLKLEQRANPRQPFEVAPGLCFPFLLCEVKPGERGLNEAQRQNVHSGAIAVRAIVQLYKDAFGATSEVRETDIYGKVLCFSISHNCSQVIIHGHCALFDAEKKAESYHHLFVEAYHLQKPDQRLKPYNFVRNLCERFSNKHLQRIKKATAELEMVQSSASSTYQELEDPRTPASQINVQMAQTLTELRTQLQQERKAHQQEQKAYQEKMSSLDKQLETQSAEMVKLRQEMRRQSEAHERSMELLIKRIPVK